MPVDHVYKLRSRSVRPRTRRRPPLRNNSSINVFLVLRLILSSILDNASVRLDRSLCAEHCKGRPRRLIGSRPARRGGRRSPAPCHTELSMSGYRTRAAFCRFHFDVFANDPGRRRDDVGGHSLSAFLLGLTVRMHSQSLPVLSPRRDTAKALNTTGL